MMRLRYDGVIQIMMMDGNSSMHYHVCTALLRPSRPSI